MQQAGVGTLLIKWGLERVDAKGITSSVVSTPNRRTSTRNSGFAEINHMDVDIAEIRGDFLGLWLWAAVWNAKGCYASKRELALCKLGSHWTCISH
jgi:hypothetical protein